MDSNHTHIFWSCKKIQPFWDEVHSALCEVLGYQIARSLLVLYLGHIKGNVHAQDQYLVKILLAAGKKALTKNWLKTATPHCKQWLTITEDIQAMEKLTYRLKLKEEYFSKG